MDGLRTTNLGEKKKEPIFPCEVADSFHPPLVLTENPEDGRGT